MLCVVTVVTSLIESVKFRGRVLKWLVFRGVLLCRVMTLAMLVLVQVLMTVTALLWAVLM